MSAPTPDHDTPTLDDVLPTSEQAIPDHREHGKTGHHLNDEQLEHRTEQERVAAGIDDVDPDEIPSATE